MQFCMKKNQFLFSSLELLNSHKLSHFPRRQAILSCSYDCFHSHKTSRFVGKVGESLFYFYKGSCVQRIYNKIYPFKVCGLLSFDYEESEILKLDDLEKIETQISLS